MHDPMTVAFNIKLPFWKTCTMGKTPYKHFYTLATIWHVDPESDGSDDSCGWFSPPLSKKAKDIIHNLAWSESRYPYFMASDAKENNSPSDCEALIFGAFCLVDECLRRRWVIWTRTPIDKMKRWASMLAHGEDSLRGSLCFKSGYHSNWYRDVVPNTPEEDQWWRERNAENFFRAIANYILRERRPWFMKPRWHIHHWSIQIHSLQQFKRWAFSRCARCGKGFKWGYSPTSYSWNSKGPQWFKSEEGVFHGDCRNPGSECCASAEPAG